MTKIYWPTGTWAKRFPHIAILTEIYFQRIRLWSIGISPLVNCQNWGNSLVRRTWVCNVKRVKFRNGFDVVDRVNWLLGAIHTCNPQLKVGSTVNAISLGAITRIDISHNCLKHLPTEIFQMCSLRYQWVVAMNKKQKRTNLWIIIFRYLNAAQNKIEKLPAASNCKYNCPLLEEIYLQDNSLEEIPCEIFRLPSLTTLDISNNKLERIPFDMWKAPKLRELNIAFNLLKELPSSRDVSVLIFPFFCNETLFLINLKSDLNFHRRMHRCFSNTHRPIRKPWRIAECKKVFLDFYSNSNSNFHFQ